VSVAPAVSAEPRSPQVKLRPLLFAIGVVCLVLLGLRIVAEPMRVSSDSMKPTYSTDDEILVQKFGAHVREPARGDIVVVRSPVSGDLVVKRVAALGGQTVGIADGVLRVDGHTVPEPYIDRAEVGGTYFGPIRVPAGTVFLLGDQRFGSVDSRTFGPVPVDSMVGRVMLRVWPP
jgi:signal peptidase I